MQTLLDFLELIFDLISDLAWPVTLLVIIRIFRQQIGNWIQTITGIEVGTGNTKVAIKAATEAREIRQQATSDVEAARLILSKLDRGDLRILRALVDEPSGRYLHSYRRTDYYRTALDKLDAMDLIYQPVEGKQYQLTDFGKIVAIEHLKSVLDLQ